MSKGPLLPIFKHETQHKSRSIPTGKILVGLLLVSAVNIFTYTNPQISSHYISSVHHKVASWTTYSAILDSISFLPEISSRAPVTPLSSERPVVYHWTPSGRTQPLATEPGIDVPETFDVNAYNTDEIDSRSSRRMTGEPGLDVWSQEDVDESLESIFDSEDFLASDHVRAPTDREDIAYILEDELSAIKQEVQPPMEWAEIVETLKEYAAVYGDGEPRPVTGEALSQHIAQRMEWDSLQVEKSE